MSRARAARPLSLAAILALAAAGCTGIGVSGNASTGQGTSGPPVKVGISLPLTGDFAALGQASERGYELWKDDVNRNGGLLGRPVRLIIRNDKSDPGTTAADYRTLIKTDGVDLTMAPFSSLLTAAAAPVAAKYGYLMTAGSAGAPSVYALKLHSLFSTTSPVSNAMVPFANWVLSLPAGQRPATAAYPAVDNPFTVPPVQTARGILERGGIRTVYAAKPYTKTSAAALSADAAQVARSHAQVVVLGSVDLPTMTAFINEFIKAGYNPQMMIASSGPDQGQAFLNAIGTGNANGVMAPNGWYPAFPNALSHVMVQDYITQFGGSGSDISSNVAEAYSAGEVIEAAITATSSLDQQKMISYLHKATVETVVGPAKFGPYGQNELATPFVSQWQPGASFVQVLPATAAGSVGILRTKPKWAG